MPARSCERRSSRQRGTPFQICQDGGVAKDTRGTEREDPLTRERIVEAAIELLDDEGEDGLTFRALATRLETGAGAIYWHIANKSELLVAASDAASHHVTSAPAIRPRAAGSRSPAPRAADRG